MTFPVIFSPPVPFNHHFVIIRFVLCPRQSFLSLITDSLKSQRCCIYLQRSSNSQAAAYEKRSDSFCALRGLEEEFIIYGCGHIELNPVGLLAVLSYTSTLGLLFIYPAACGRIAPVIHFECQDWKRL